MSTELPAEGFLRHRGLILVAVGGAAAEGGLLTLVAPAARSVAPQVTALPSVAAYHDLRWLFTDSQSWLWFAGLVAALLIVRSAIDVALLRLAWPRGLPAPSLRRSFASCAALTALAWLLLTPAATLAFGVAVIPFSWPFLAAFPIMLGIVLALSHGGAYPAWWRRLPPVRAVAWLLGSFIGLTAAGAVIAHLPTAQALPVIAAAGLVNARAWYGIARLAARWQPRAHESVPARVLFGLPSAPLAALLVIVLVIGVARLMFTGTIVLPISDATGSPAVAANVFSGSGATTSVDGIGSPVGVVSAASAPSAAAVPAAVLVVGGWGSSCCDAGDGLRADLRGVTVRQFSYLGLGANGRPLPSGAAADDLPLPVLGDRLAGQVEALHEESKEPVDIVAESEGTLAVYAMLDRHPGLPVGAIVLLSPIVEPGQLSYPAGDGTSVSEDALDELNSLVGSISPYGPGGAADLLNSVSEFGAKYFADVANGAGLARGADGRRIRWLAVVPLADAVTLPDCGLPTGVLVVPALHGGLLGDPTVQPMVAQFLSGRQVTDPDDAQLRSDAELITSVATAWRMPATTSACPG
jgi:hypothetical protein